ncbi:MAG: phosphoribosyltransferase family protein [Candidatus Aenigmarchaeota archaeon]|nr:phosphoribosyltransferase family protein [Candidatus Aenigmarchaeota archaeon]MDI6721921.1 phosphoribosyltransferase family protein [Candidatus Aenigmarchaeota archaeon]
MPDFVIGREDFSRSLAQELGCEYREFRHLYYLDGEPNPKISAKYEEIGGRDVILVLRGSQRSEYNKVARNLHNFERHIGNLHRVFRAGSIDVIMPYFWLGRQDHNPRTDSDPNVRERDYGKDIGYESLAITFKAQGAHRIITITPHFYRQKGTIKAADIIDVISLSGTSALARYAKELIDEGSLSRDALLIGPDLNSNLILSEFSGLMRHEMNTDSFKTNDKKRLDDQSVRHNKKINTEGRDVLIVDDIISTAGTLESEIDNLENHGYVDCFAIHGVLPEKGHDRTKAMLGKKVRRFITTDTVDCDYSRASVIPEIVEFYRKEKQKK